MDDNPLLGPPDVPVVGDLPAVGEVPRHPDTLPDGSPTLVIGDPEGLTRFNHQQGDNPLGFQQDCGLVSCQDILQQFGFQVSEADVVQFASDHGLCQTDGPPQADGGTTISDQTQILSDLGVPAQYRTDGTLESLAQDVGQGKGVIVEVNAGVLWNDPNHYGDGSANHAIVVTGVAVDPTSGAIQGFYVNDSGANHSGQFVDAATMQAMWGQAGGTEVATDASRPGV